jgi:hypothetical protein
MKWIYRFFVVLGVIFFCILIGLGYFVIADPLNIRPVLSSMYGSPETRSTTVPSGDVSTEATAPSGTATQNTNPGTLSDEQATALESVGLTPDVVPPQFTPEQIDCFIGVLGEARVNEIKAGDTPTPTEFFTAKNCI